MPLCGRCRFYDGLSSPDQLRRLARASSDLKRRAERFYLVARDWQGPLPDLLDYFQPSEIDFYLGDAVRERYRSIDAWERASVVSKFVARCGYRNEPEGASKETPVHAAAKRAGYDGVVQRLLEIYERHEVNHADRRGYTHFHAACRHGAVDSVARYLDLGVDPNLRVVETDDLPLHSAVVGGHKQVVELLLRKGATADRCNGRGFTPLHLICKSLHDPKDMVEFFLGINEELGRPVNVDARDKEGKTALHWALDRLRRASVDSLLRHGADPNIGDLDEGWTALHLVSRMRYLEDLVELFYRATDERGCRLRVDLADRKGRTPLFFALCRGSKRTAELLLRHGADTRLIYGESWRATALHLICDRDSDNDLLESFFEISDEREQRRAEVDVLDKQGRAPLHFAVGRGLKRATRTLLRRGADPTRLDGCGHTALFYIASRQKDDEFADWFFDVCEEFNHEARRIVDAQGEKGLTALHLALKCGLQKMAKTLLRRGDADPNLPNVWGSTALHYLVRKGKLYEKFPKAFLEVCAEKQRRLAIDARDCNGDTPLHVALKFDMKKAAEALLGHGADRNQANARGSTPLHILCQERDKVDDDDDDDNFVTLFFGDVGSDLNVNARDVQGRTPLLLACEHGKSKKAIELLLDRGAEPTTLDDARRTVLHVMCQRKRSRGRLSTESFLRMCDAKGWRVEIDAVDDLGRTPLQWAVASVSPEAVRTLLDRGADLSKFVFPSEDYFAREFDKTDACYCDKFRLAFGTLVSLSHLEDKGYVLQRRDIITIVKSFVEYGVFETPEQLQDLHKSRMPFVKYGSKRTTIKRGGTTTVYDLIELTPEEASKLVTYEDCLLFGESNRLSTHIGNPSDRLAVARHMCEKLTRGFFRLCAAEFCQDLVHASPGLGIELPIECAEMIVDRSWTNKDLFNICLAAEKLIE